MSKIESMTTLEHKAHFFPLGNTNLGDTTVVFPGLSTNSAWCYLLETTKVFENCAYQSNVGIGLPFTCFLLSLKGSELS